LRSTEEIAIVENDALEDERPLLIQAAPNPFDATTKISVYGFEEEVSVQLIDFTGTVRYSKEKHKATEDIYLGEDISSGTYALIVSDQFRSKQIKIIKLQ
jgi:hypothetical protein